MITCLLPRWNLIPGIRRPKPITLLPEAIPPSTIMTTLTFQWSSILITYMAAPIEGNRSSLNKIVQYILSPWSMWVASRSVGGYSLATYSWLKLFICYGDLGTAFWWVDIISWVRAYSKVVVNTRVSFCFYFNNKILMYPIFEIAYLIRITLDIGI